MEKGSKDQGERTSRSYGQQVMTVRTPVGLRAQKHMAGRGREETSWCRRHTSSRLGMSLFVGKDEACVMNRKKKEKSLLRKEGNVYVHDLFVRVPSSVAAPIVYTPMEADAINQVADGREPRRRVTFYCNSPTFLTAGVVSVDETVRPQLNERFEKRQECDSVLSAAGGASVEDRSKRAETVRPQVGERLRKTTRMWTVC